MSAAVDLHTQSIRTVIWRPLFCSCKMLCPLLKAKINSFRSLLCILLSFVVISMTQRNFRDKYVLKTRYILICFKKRRVKKNKKKHGIICFFLLFLELFELDKSRAIHHQFRIQRSGGKTSIFKTVKKMLEVFTIWYIM